MIYAKTTFVAFLALVDTATVHAVLRGNRTPLDPTKELRTAMNKIRALKVGADDNAKAVKQNKGEREPPTENPAAAETTAPTALPTGPPTGLISEMPSMTPVAQPTALPTSQPTLLPTSKPTAAPAIFDSTIEVFCKPDGITALSSQEVSAKTIICDANKPSCREAVTAVRESEQLQNFFGCAGDLGEGAARKLFQKYSSNDILVGQLVLIAATNAILVTERPDTMKAACAAIAAMQSPAVADPCCQGSSGCTSVTGSASNSPPFMTIAITACTGDSACKDMGPNPLILDSSCTGASACELMNENEINPSITGVTFVGEMACTTPQSCEGVGRRSHGDVTIQTGACIGSDACNSAGRRVVQKSPSYRFRSHIDIGPNACVGANACKDAHSTVNHGTAGKPAGSLTIGAGGCADDGSCEKMGFNDRMKTDIIVPPGGCGSVEGCRGCMTKDECSPDEFYFVSDIDGACPKGGNDSNMNPTGDKVEEYCIGKDTLPTDCPTFSPTPFPTPLTSSPTSAPTISPSRTPSFSPSHAPSRVPSEMPSDIPSSLPSSSPSQVPSEVPSAQPSDLPSEEPSAQPSHLPSAQPSDLPSEEPSQVPSEMPSVQPSDHPSEEPSVQPSEQPSEEPSAQPSDLPSEEPSVGPSSQPSQEPTKTSSPTLPPPSLNVGCLAEPGNGASTFNAITGDVVCDEATGACANFVSMVDALADEGKRNMVKSIFGCSHEGMPNVVTQQVAQARFDKIKNDKSVTDALLAIVNEDKKLYTGSASAVTNACAGDCCSDVDGCTIDPVDGGVMTVSSGSCTGNQACIHTRPNAIILDSCKGLNACFRLGNFSDAQPGAGVEVGFRVIGPRACFGEQSCNVIGREGFGNIRVEEGACDAMNACSAIAMRTNQGLAPAPLIVANVFIGNKACTGERACNKLHRRSSAKFEGSVIIEAGACVGANTCEDLGTSDSAISDIRIKTGVCTTDMPCNPCVLGLLCASNTATFVIDEVADCTPPFDSACEEL